MELLHSLQLGEGSKQLLVLHGFLGMGDNWKTHGKRWAEQGWEVHLLDLRNHGRSFWSKAFDYALMAEDVKRYCDHHAIKTATVLGHSMGGKVAMLLACRFPNYVSQLIIADIAPKAYAPHHQTILKGLGALDFTKIQSRKEAEITLANYVEEPAVRQFLLKNIYRVQPDQLGLRLNIAVLQLAGEQVGEALRQELKFSKKTLFLKGENSGYISDEDELVIRHHFSAYKIVQIPRAGHWLHAENPQDFLEAIESWWND